MSSAYLQRPDYHQHLEPFSFRDLQRLRLTPPEEEDEAKAALPKAALSPRPGRRSAAFPRRPVQRMTSRGNCTASSATPRTLTRTRTMRRQPNTTTSCLGLCRHPEPTRRP